MDNATRELRRVNESIRIALAQSAITDEQWQRLTREQYEAERAVSERTGRRRLHLACGHTRTIDVGTYEELDVDDSGSAQCRATKTIGFSHRGDYFPVLGWQPGGGSRD